MNNNIEEAKEDGSKNGNCLVDKSVLSREYVKDLFFAFWN